MPTSEVDPTAGNTGANVRAMQIQLAGLGAVIDPTEQAATSYGPSTMAAVRAFRERHGLPDADAVDPSTARLMQVASALAGTGGREDVRSAVRTAAAAADTSQPEELYWLARYATIAGDYQTAHDLARRIPEHEGIKSVVAPILAPPEQPVQPTPGQPPVAPQPRSPEMPHPENFYSYRRDFYPLDVLNDMQRQIAAVGQHPRDPSQAYSGFADRGIVFIQAAATWFEALKQWQIGNTAANRRNYGVAQAAYDACQSAVCDYFSKYYSINVGSGPLAKRLEFLIVHLANAPGGFWEPLWSKIRRRRDLLSLKELSALDWPEPRPNIHIPRRFDPSPIVGTLPPKPDYALGFIQQYFQRGEFGEDPAAPARQHDLEAPLITLAFVLVPLARAETNRARRQFDGAIRDLRWVLDSIVVKTIPGLPPLLFYADLACKFIELPFAKLLLAETMLDKADTEYKARIAADPPPAPDVTAYQGLKAAQTYLAVKDQFATDGDFVTRVDAGRDRLVQQIQQHLAGSDTLSREFRLLGNDVTIPTIAPSTSTLPGLDRRTKAHESLLKFTPPDGQAALRETNPRVYAVLLTAQAKLEQLKAGFNCLGYLDTYVPPWRFQFLLERARYFSEHAKNAQREYLNFLNNAEREEFQELGASQNVEMEKSNVRIETARVDQVRLEAAVALQSKELAELTRENAKKRHEDYKDFDEFADDMDWMNRGGMAAGIVGGIISGALKGGVWGAIGGGLSAAGSAVQQEAHLQVADEQREFEKRNLARAIEEAKVAAEVAKAQLVVAEAGLVVAGLQRQAALLRHEFAVQNLQFLRNRVLSAEQWYRLVAAIRSVSETYLRYAVELAFLAEQAYEFEADKRINVIRFDYDFSEVGDFLAADFLLKDLDTMEHDLIITQRQRQQQVRYVLSMAREFPEALQEIRDRGKATFSLRLEQFERRFPGLYNIRIGAVDVLPVALMDATRFSLELTHLGTSQVRLKAQPDTPPGTPSPSPLNTNDLPVPEGEWLAELQEAWPAKLRVTGPETAVFSGLTRQDANAVFPLATTGQRHAFEALGAAAAWQVDFTARENQFVPESLADLLITFTLSGYHDSELRAAIDEVKPRTSALTSILSAQQLFPDALYDFSRTGRMVWKVPRGMLTLNGDLGRLRNIGFSLRPGAPNAHFSRLLTRLRVNFRVHESSSGASGVTILTAIPAISVAQTAPLTVAVRATLDTATELAWDFGDGTAIRRTSRSNAAPLAPAEETHKYARPGRYVIKLRCVQNGSLSEFRINVAVSRAQKVGDPLIVLPGITFDPASKRISLTTSGAVPEAGRLLWRVGDASAEGNGATFMLEPGHYTLDFVAVRQLSFRAYSTQRYIANAAPLRLIGLSATTDRTFDPNSMGTGTNGNELSRRLFGSGEISPEDEWTFELIPQEVVGLPAGTDIGTEQLELSDIQDVALWMEYEVTPGGPH
jgi:hypothetical protein